MEAIRWTQGVVFPAERPLLNLSQAAPVGAPPLALREELARLVMDDVGVHLYGPDLGYSALRAQVAEDWSHDYGGTIEPDQVAITAGCNQAFCAAIACLAKAGDAVILPSPYYFNHVMHLTTVGVEPRLLPCGPDMVPDLERAEAMIDANVKAIVLVSPNNPTGAEYPEGVIAAFYALAKRHGLPLILDETYRDFRASDVRPHGLFDDPDWAETLIHLYSFSKTFRLTGHRVGAMIAGTDVLAEVEKYIDSVTICPNQLGQRAALFGLRHLGHWVAGERQEILRRKSTIEAVFADFPDATLLSSGAYFAFVDHGFDMSSDVVAERFVREQSVLMLPATMFSHGTDPVGPRCLRVAFANADLSGIAEFGRRWKDFAAAI